MKTWKHLAFVAVLAVFGIIAIFTACDNDNTKIDPKCECTEKVHTDAECDCNAVGYDCTCTYEPVNNDPVLCTCPNGTVYYDEECPCDGSDCKCISEYKPVFSDMFNFLDTDVAGATSVPMQNAYNIIWNTNPQLILKLMNAVAIKGSPIDITYVDENTTLTIVFLSNFGRIRLWGNVADDYFTVLFETALEDCVAFYLQQ